MILLILCFIPRVLSEVSLQHHVYMSRKSKSHSEPFQSGFVYNNVGNNPGAFTTFDIGTSNSEPISENYNMEKYATPMEYTHPISLSKGTSISPAFDLSPSKRAIDYAIAKSESKYTTKFLPTKIKTDGMYEKLKSAMHFTPSDADIMSGYEDEYHVDNEDIRTSSSGFLDSWPYYYHNPYEYEHMKIDAEIEKAKDKRYAVDAAKVIPIHEDLSGDIPNSYEMMFTPNYYGETTTDNPMSGHDPFFSFMLNDYFNKNSDDDLLVFKGQEWAKDFDHEAAVEDIDGYAKRNRRLQSDYQFPENLDSISNYKQNNIKSTNSESVTEKGFSTKQDFDKHEKGNQEKADNTSKYKNNGKHFTGFKDFVDAFANKFGSEDHKKNSKYILKRNQDKGENKKGFRRVYHKDEYQEDNEFFDNNNSSSKYEDKGSSNALAGGSEAFLKSHATAALGDKTSTYDESGDKGNKQFENSYKGYDSKKGFDGQFNRYRDVAKKMAQSNEADYPDHIRI